MSLVVPHKDILGLALLNCSLNLSEYLLGITCFRLRLRVIDIYHSGKVIPDNVELRGLIVLCIWHFVKEEKSLPVLVGKGIIYQHHIGLCTYQRYYDILIVNDIIELGEIRNHLLC